MSVASIGLDQTVSSSSLRSSIKEAHQDFAQLYQALQSGNLNSAQQAYASFQQIQAGLPAAATTSAAAATTTTNPVTTDWSALGQALQSGSLSSSQDALAKLGQDAQAAWQTRMQQETQNAQSVYALMQSAQGNTVSSAATATASPSAGSAIQNDLNALNQSLQSGDTSAAQKILAQLVQDMQAAGQTAAQTGTGHHHHHHHGGFAATNAASAYAATAATDSTATTTSASAGASATV